MIPVSSSNATGAPTPAVAGAAPVPAGNESPGLTPAATQLAAAPAQEAAEPVLCNHCGRTASNGLSCIGACVADSGY